MLPEDRSKGAFIPTTSPIVGLTYIKSFQWKQQSCSTTLPEMYRRRSSVSLWVMQRREPPFWNLPTALLGLLSEQISFRIVYKNTYKNGRGPFFPNTRSPPESEKFREGRFYLRNTQRKKTSLGYSKQMTLTKNESSFCFFRCCNRPTI